MQILISGGTGFLGRALTHALLTQGHQVTWLTRDVQQPHPTQVTLCCYDSLSTTDYFDGIINLAGAGIADKRWTDKRKQLLLESRLQPTQRLLDFIAKAKQKPRLLLSGSAVGWYGVQGDKPLDERSCANPDFAHHICHEWETLAMQADIPVIILRTGVVIHPSGGMLARLLPVFKLGLGGRLGNGLQVMSWIAREDWVDAVIFLLHNALLNQHGHAGVYNLTAPYPVNNLHFTKTLANALHRPALLPLPESVLGLLLGEMKTLLVDGQRVLPKRLQKEGFNFQFNTLSDALQFYCHQ